MCTCREAFDHVVDRSMALVNHLGQGGPLAVHNIDNLMLRESMDVIGVPGMHLYFIAAHSAITW